MGAVLDMPRDAWPWSVEVRSASVYLYAVGLPDGFPAVRSGLYGDVVSLTLQRSTLAPLAVACSVVLAHPSMARRQRVDESWSASTCGPRFAVLRGRGLVYFMDESAIYAGMASTVEVEHDHVAALRAAALAHAEQVSAGVSPSQPPSPR